MHVYEILVAKEKDHAAVPQDLCPTDFSDASLQTLDVAIRLAQGFKAELCVLHVVAPSAIELGVESYGAAEDEGVDLIVLATHGATGWYHFFYGSVAEEFMHATTFPLLIIHAPQMTSQK